MKLAEIGVAALRSVNAGTGALLGGVAPWALALGSKMAMIAIGPSIPMGTADVFALMFLLFLSAVGAASGALVGSLVHLLVSRTRLAGPADRRMVTGGLALAVVLAALWGVRGVDYTYRPRVIRSTGAVTRLEGASALAPSTPATRLYDRGYGPYAQKVSPLQWQGRNVWIALEGQTLIIGRGSEVVDRVSLKGLNAVQEVYGATAGTGSSREWLALEVRLQRRGRREVLLVYDAAGRLSHQELLADRSAPGPPRPRLWSTGRAGDQTFMLDLGEPVRYAANR